ncbi:hypothetical protein A3J90_04870 [candidate division WOR-1 bacterium RIFOXYC2_FULL_37_10]|uniref:Uncharacterized protein n=1 Tax=candidate division WOR-1 bacterium RIFOXYB2_FULL_37_13 TaxID=1802579 RepID=A0A1F4SVR3_UNCSA|nr:MAG: hypothetical protein A2246_05005 [candidate division WOR-1 bacterium RIFOXYA2_FULL_37_7]OGC24457.1 MAG: hypothetical protein A2310_08640 [candidate division WOR-1 bacterium RIFOXYB2_FULL_37_13]OGC35554.1 MAG: hypothetical protein A3J90_04870 [candidate division WOR-1 bacterium RIFOXYC2_FULL_37_10]
MKVGVKRFAYDSVKEPRLVLCVKNEALKTAMLHGDVEGAGWHGFIQSKEIVLERCLSWGAIGASFKKAEEPEEIENKIIRYLGSGFLAGDVTRKFFEENIGLREARDNYKNMRTQRGASQKIIFSKIFNADRMEAQRTPEEIITLRYYEALVQTLKSKITEANLWVLFENRNPLFERNFENFSSEKVERITSFLFDEKDESLISILTPQIALFIGTLGSALGSSFLFADGRDIPAFPFLSVFIPLLLWNLYITWDFSKRTTNAKNYIFLTGLFRGIELQRELLSFSGKSVGGHIAQQERSQEPLLSTTNSGLKALAVSKN